MSPLFTNYSVARRTLRRRQARTPTGESRDERQILANSQEFQTLIYLQLWGSRTWKFLCISLSDALSLKSLLRLVA